MIYLYEIWDTIWNFVDSVFWVIPLLGGVYVIVHTVGDPYRKYKRHQKEQDNIKIHYEYLGNPEGKEERNEQSLKRDMELDLTGKNAATAGSGNGASARKSAGFESWTTTNNSYGSGGSNSSGTVTDGTQRVLTEAILKGELKSCFDNGGDPDLLLVGSFNKQKVSGFTGNSTRMDMAEDRSLVATIDVYVSDFGEVRVVADRILRSSGRTAHVVDTEMWSAAYLRPFQVQDLAKTGDAEKKQLLVEYTLVSKNEAASGKIADLTTS